ncbi:MAG: fasciclin domain-containing protein [Gloeotrichia echinulata GP01]
MNLNYNQFIRNLAGIVGLTGVSLLITLPSGAKEALNPHPSIFSETPYNRSQPIEVNSQYNDAQPGLETSKGNKRQKPGTAPKSGNSPLNPRPSIFNEPRYNRGNRTAPTPSNPPEATPTTPSTETPSTTEPTPSNPSTGTPSTTEPTNKPATSGTTNTQGKNLVAIIAEAKGSFSILKEALKAAGLTETLQGKDNFTIFAPTDAAFKKLPADALRDLLKPENKEVLVKLLTYHVVSGTVLSSDLKSGQVKSIEGGDISVKVDDKTGVSVNDAQVIQADIKGSNGVIHAINQVILPPDL